MARDLSKILIIDLEATCWEDNSNPPLGEVSEIIEIGCALLDTKTRSVIDKKSILVTPAYSKVSPFCTKLTTITQEFLNQNGINFPEAVSNLKKDFKPNNITWASFGDYDRVQMDRNCKLYGIQNPLGRTHINVKNLFALKNNLPKEIGMSQALQKLGLDLVGVHHRGIDDACNIANILISLLK